MTLSTVRKPMEWGCVALLVATPLQGLPQVPSHQRPVPGGASDRSHSEHPRLDSFAYHVLRRTGYGADRWSRNRIAELGSQAYIEEQLHPQSIDDSSFETRIAGYASLSLGFEELRSTYCSSCSLGGANVPRREMREAKILRAVYSRRQLEAVLTDFWFDHFNVDASRQLSRWAVVPYERDAIRPHVLGRFEDMLVATAQSTAMLDYLDNRFSTFEGYVAPGGQVLGLNENYARELLELHTLGVDGGYTQDDVIEVARIMTGWSTNASGFIYKDFIHDQDPKLFLGTLAIPADGGMTDGLTLLSFLASSPVTAERLSRLLCQRFVDEDPPPSIVQAAAATYMATDGDLREVMRVILLSDEFAAQPYGTKVKRPLVVLASAARALGATTLEADVARVHSEIRGMGEGLYEAAPPTGYPDVSEHWAGEGTLIGRFNAIQWLVFEPAVGIQLGIPDGTSREIVDALLPRLMQRGLSPANRGAIEAHLDGLPGAPLADRVGDAAALILSSPSFLRY